MTYPTPTGEGHFWAKLKLAANPDHNSHTWEVVFVFENIAKPWCEADIETGEHLMASVPGIEGAQPIDAFVWGPPVTLPSDLRATANRQATA